MDHGFAFLLSKAADDLSILSFPPLTQKHGHQEGEQVVLVIRR